MCAAISHKIRPKGCAHMMAQNPNFVDIHHHPLSFVLRFLFVPHARVCLRRIRPCILSTLVVHSKENLESLQNEISVCSAVKWHLPNAWHFFVLFFRSNVSILYVQMHTSFQKCRHTNSLQFPHQNIFICGTRRTYKKLRHPFAVLHCQLRFVNDTIFDELVNFDCMHIVIGSTMHVSMDCSLPALFMTHNSI